MLNKIFISVVILFSFACNGIPVKAQRPTDTSSNNYGNFLKEREEQAVEKNTDSLGTVISHIKFQVKTDNLTDYKEGFIPWIELEYPAKVLKQLIAKDSLVINENKVTLIIDYPLTKEDRFELISNGGFTREQLVKEISKRYHQIYEEEEATATIKTIPVKKRKTLYNRNRTNGKYGIWGHDISDLVLDEIIVYRSSNGSILLSLNIES